MCEAGQNGSMEPFDPSRLADFGVWYVIFLFSLTLHEGAHALLARWGGDDTAYHGGQVTLNPWPHMRREPLGTVLIPIASFFFMGWMMGWASTPFDPYWAQRHPRRAALMSCAGPAANLLIALTAFFILKGLLMGGVMMPAAELAMSGIVEPADPNAAGGLLTPVGMALSIALSLNILLGLFNLIPLPPLDGAGIVQGLFPDTLGRAIAALAANPMMSMLGIVLAWQVIGFLFRPVLSFVLLALGVV